MSINLEQIDELRKRADVSYEAARDALEKFDSNMVDALIYLEKNKEIRSRGHHCHEHHSYQHDNFNYHGHRSGEHGKHFKALWNKGNEMRVIITREDKTLLDLPLLLSSIVGLLTIHISVVALIVALIFGCRFKLQRGSVDMKVNDTLNRMSDSIDLFKKKLTEEV